MANNKIRILPVIISLLIFFFIIGQKRAYAYLDPGSSSFIFQIIIAGFLTGLYFLKRFWVTIKNFFIKLFSGKKTTETNDNE